MEIIAHSSLLRKARTIEGYKDDLGFNLKGAVQNKPNGAPSKITIKDPFIKKYENINGRLIYKYGNLGNIKFYNDLSMEHNQLCVFDGENIFEVVLMPEELSGSFKTYLNDLLKAIYEGCREQIEYTVNEEMKDKIYTNMPEDVDRPDIAMPYEQYIDALVKKRQKLSNV